MIAKLFSIFALFLWHRIIGRVDITSLQTDWRCVGPFRLVAVILGESRCVVENRRYVCDFHRTFTPFVRGAVR